MDSSSPDTAARRHYFTFLPSLPLRRRKADEPLSAAATPPSDRHLHAPVAKASEKMLARSKSSSQGSLIGFGGFAWELLIFGSLAILNLVAIALFASPSLDKGGTPPPGFDAEASGVEAALVGSPHSEGRGEEIRVSSTSGSHPTSKDAVINLDQ